MSQFGRRLGPAARAATVVSLLPPPAGAAVGPPAVINNGTVQLGIQPDGNLMVGSGDGPPSSQRGPGSAQGADDRDR